MTIGESGPPGLRSDPGLFPHGAIGGSRADQGVRPPRRDERRRLKIGMKLATVVRAQTLQFEAATVKVHATKGGRYEVQPG